MGDTASKAAGFRATACPMGFAGAPRFRGVSP